jgi:hypothetical protein
MTEIEEGSMPGVTEFERAYDAALQGARGLPTFEDYCDGVDRGHEELAAQFGQDEEAHGRLCDQMWLVQAAERLAEELRKALDGDEEARGGLGLSIQGIARDMRHLGLITTSLTDAELDEFAAARAAARQEEGEPPVLPIERYALQYRPGGYRYRVLERAGLLPAAGDLDAELEAEYPSIHVQRRYEHLSCEWHVREFRRAVEALRS